LANVHFVRQKEQLGLGHAIYYARHHIGTEPFAVLLGDEIFVHQAPTLAQLMAVHEQVGGSVVGVIQVPPEEVDRYGVIRSEPVAHRLYRVLELVEKPTQQEAPSNLAIAGRYVLDPGIFEILGSLPPGKNGEIQLTDALQVLGANQPVYGFELDACRYDVGEKLGYLKATVELALAREDLAGPFGEYLDRLVARRTSMTR
jgi:UTP--glucose-1-phosphate uridylyltransferase